MSGSLHIHNARIWTGDALRPWAGSVTIENGRITSFEARPARRNTAQSHEAQTIDAGGRVITPGLIDSHMHLLQGGQSLVLVDLSQLRSRAEFERAIEHAHAQL